MTLIQIVVLAIVQGLTEFLPISSSGHLILAPALLGWEDQGIAFDVAVHFGTLAGVVGYFRHDLADMTAAVLKTLSGGDGGADAKLAGLLVVATIPVGLVGLLAHDWIAAMLRSPAIIAAATAFFGVFLWAADAAGSRRRGVESLDAPRALFIGLMQVLALIPGTSRSGITITAGLSLGLTREAAARFSFLLAVPVIVFAAALETVRLAGSGAAVDWTPLVLAAVLAAIVAYLSVRIFLNVVERLGMVPFVIYRLLLAAVIWYVLVR